MRVGLLALVPLQLSPWAAAEHNCLPGFRYVGSLPTVAVSALVMTGADHLS